MLLSFVIPTYNRAFKVKRAVESILNQAGDPSLSEIIVVDDGSTDGTEQTLKPYVQQREIRYIKHEVNQGVAGAKNTGIMSSKNRFVVLLDSDDLLAEGGLSYLIKAVEADEYDIVFLGSKLLSTGQLMFDPGFKGLKTYQELLKNSIGEYLPVCRTEVLQKHLLRDLRGYESITWLRVARSGYKIFYDPQAVRLYDNAGDDRLSNRLGILKNSRDMMEGYGAYLKDFGSDLRKANLKAFVLICMKFSCYYVLQLSQLKASR